MLALQDESIVIWERNPSGPGFNVGGPQVIPGIIGHPFWIEGHMGHIAGTVTDLWIVK